MGLMAVHYSESAKLIKGEHGIKLTNKAFRGGSTLPLIGKHVLFHLTHKVEDHRGNDKKYEYILNCHLTTITI